MGILTKIDNAIIAFKSELFSGSVPYYERYSNGDHYYTHDTEINGLLSMFGIGDRYDKAKENLKCYYRDVFYLQDCINLYADFASQVKIQEVDDKGNEVRNSEYVNLLQEPNAFQNGKEFIKEMVINVLTTGGSFQYGNYFKNGKLRTNAQLFNLDFNCLSFPKIKNRYLLSRKDVEELRVKETLADSETRWFKMHELAFFYDTIPHNGLGSDKGKYNADNYLKPMSRLFALATSLNTLINSQSSMSYTSGHNVNKALSKKAGSGSGLSALPYDQKNDIERKINGHGKYGMKHGKAGDIFYANEELALLDLTRDGRKMQLIENQENAKDNVRNTFLIPMDFFGESTYENKQMSEARFILGQVKTITDNWLSELTNKSPGIFKEKGHRLVGTYNHLTSVSETKRKLENEGLSKRAEAMVQLVEAYRQMKESVNPSLEYEDFLIANQFTDYLKIE